MLRKWKSLSSVASSHRKGLQTHLLGGHVLSNYLGVLWLTGWVEERKPAEGHVQVYKTQLFSIIISFFKICLCSSQQAHQALGRFLS